MVAGIQAGGSQTISKENRSACRVRHLAHSGVNMLSIRSKCKSCHHRYMKSPELESGAFLIRQGLVPRLVAVVPPIEPFSYVIGYASQEGEDKETAKEESP